MSPKMQNNAPINVAYSNEFSPPSIPDFPPKSVPIHQRLPQQGASEYLSHPIAIPLRPRFYMVSFGYAGGKTSAPLSLASQPLQRVGRISLQSHPKGH